MKNNSSFQNQLHLRLIIYLLVKKNMVMVNRFSIKVLLRTKAKKTKPLILTWGVA